MAIETVIVELDEPSNDIADDIRMLKGVLEDFYHIYDKDGNVAVDVPDSSDAEDEVTDKLCDAGIEAFVYLKD